MAKIVSKTANYSNEKFFAGANYMPAGKYQISAVLLEDCYKGQTGPVLGFALYKNKALVGTLQYSAMVRPRVHDTNRVLRPSTLPNNSFVAELQQALAPAKTLGEALTIARKYDGNVTLSYYEGVFYAKTGNLYAGTIPLLDK